MTKQVVLKMEQTSGTGALFQSLLCAKDVIILCSTLLGLGHVSVYIVLCLYGAAHLYFVLA